MNLLNLQQHWNEFGATDPFWAILSDPSKRHGGWNTEEFFDTGRRWMAEVVGYLDARGLVSRRARALDFGSGAGRLTQALCGYFDRCDGVDIAPSMIRLANEFNRFGDRCCYHLNGAADLRLFADGTFDFVYSKIVLQHMEPQYARKYIGEFLRVLAPGGVAMFQLPGDLIPVEARRAVASVAKIAGTNDVADRAATGPLPDSACKAQVTLLNPPPDRPAGSQYLLRVLVRNLGNITWPARGDADGRFRVKIGSRWFDSASASVVGRENSSTLLPGPVAPGTQIEVPVLINVPNDPGQYVADVGPLQEAVRWFSDTGSAPARAWVGVFHPPPATGAGSAEIQMYGMPRRQVVEVVESFGGRVLDVVEDQMAGEHWESFTYCATR